MGSISLGMDQLTSEFRRVRVFPNIFVTNKFEKFMCSWILNDVTVSMWNVLLILNVG